MAQQRTLAAGVELKGIGVDTGSPGWVQLLPAGPDHGLWAETAAGCRAPVALESVRNCVRGVSLGVGRSSVGSVEHLLAALVGTGVTNVRIVLDGPEVPFLDGSALPFVEAIRRAGLVDQPGTLPELRVRRGVLVEDGRRKVEILPAPDLVLDVKMDFGWDRIGRQHFQTALTPERFCRMVAPARAFGAPTDTHDLFGGGPQQRASLASPMVMDGNRGVSPPMRYQDEDVRHEALDLLGDLALLEYPLKAQVVACNAGHALYHQALRNLLERPECWELADPGRRSPWSVHPYSSEEDMVWLCAG